MKSLITILQNACLAIFFSLLLTACTFSGNQQSKVNSPILSYTVSTPNPANQTYQVELLCKGLPKDTIDFEMAKWMPGYYQIMNYANKVSRVVAQNTKGDTLPVNFTSNDTWQVVVNKNSPFKLSYNVSCDRKFVATNFLDSTHGYIVPPATFMYIKGHMDLPVSVHIDLYKEWKDIATGLERNKNESHRFQAPNFDILFDCPILMGNLQQLPSFHIDGIEHKFVGYKMGEFDHNTFIDNLSKAVSASIDVIGDIPYSNYTFIAIGPGRGGIEHLNNTTVSFDGSELNTRESMIRILSFLTHEYFHHFNVKRIRPFELGPFKYDSENRTNLLWVSEGLTVYYEDIILARANLISEEEFLKNIEKRIEVNENNPGRLYQSLIQASFNTWNDGPFGKQGKEAGKTISYYQKGPLVGLILDLTIRNATQNAKSLDDVMKQLYWEFYKKKKRGFTDAEFQQVCEDISGTSLCCEFEYVNTTKDIDYNKYLSYAGLLLKENYTKSNKSYSLTKVKNPNTLQVSILNGLQKH